jgi:DNA repair protein RadC
MWTSYKIELVRTKIAEPKTTFDNPAAVAREYAWLEKYDREHLIRLDLDTQNRLIGEETVAIGTSDMVALSPREIFRGALLSGAKGIILIHNHPSGRMEFSDEDLACYKGIQEAGIIMGIKLLDFIIIGETGDYKSMN